jgi:hypothetical protein
MIKLDHESLPKEIKFKSSSGSHGIGTGQCDYTLRLLTNNSVSLDKRNFVNIPEWMDFPEIIIPPKENF